ncbi:MAG: ABC transporter permease [Spirochaetaceae bacterium]|nr:MAG: ABC transporter permease [Spirochaetaceae bacterium]
MNGGGERAAEIAVAPDTVTVTGVVTRDTVGPMFRTIRKSDLSRIKTINLERVTTIDSAGAAFIDVMMDRVTRRDACRVIAGDDVSEMLSALHADVKGARRRRPRLLKRAGKKASSAFSILYAYLQLSADVFVLAFFGFFRKMKKRPGATWEQCVRIGVESVMIIGLLSFVIGLILALQSAAQLRQFGANIFVADLLAVSVVREMGPMMTAIIVAGRTGSAIAAEVATMKVTEEMEALTVMGLDPIRFVVVPKFHAITLVMPILVTLSIVAAILGGAVVAVNYLDLSPVVFFRQAFNAVGPEEFVMSIVKSLFFAWTIVIIGSFHGFRVTGGADGVGRVTTSAVVASISAVIVIDVVFSMLYLF